MNTCNKCHRELHGPGRQPFMYCPYCGGEIAGVAVDDPWLKVVEFDNAAEAGYFSNRIEQAEIPTRILQRDRGQFDGGWHYVYALEVPRSQAKEAALLMKRDLDDESTIPAPHEPALYEPAPYEPVSDKPSGRFPDEPEKTPRPASPQWIALAVVMAVGAGIYWFDREAGQADGENRVKRAGTPLWEAIDELDKPFYTEPATGPPVNRLRFDDHAGRVILEEDFDGDGRLDRRRVFDDGVLVRDEDVRNN